MKRLPGWTLVLALAWLLLGARLGYAFAHGESFAGDLALPALAFFVVTALGGSRLFGALQRNHAPS